MKKNLKKSMDEFFAKEPTVGEKAWDIIHQFYHLVLTRMKKEGVTRADLARRLGKSRAAISYMLNKTPNITVKKMVEIADAVDLNINLTNKRFLAKNKTKQFNNKEIWLIPQENMKELVNEDDEYRIKSSRNYSKHFKSSQKLENQAINKKNDLSIDSVI